MKDLTIEEKVVDLLSKHGETISTMESCTGGYLSSTITNVEGSADVFHFAAVTYSDEYKIKFGVDKEVIDKYGCYSLEVARLMAKKIMFFAESTYGVGVTGKLNKEDGIVYVSIFDGRCRKYYDMKIKCPNKKRVLLKKYVVDKILNKLYKIIGDN